LEPRRREGREGRLKHKIDFGFKQEKRLWFMVPFASFAPSRFQGFGSGLSGLGKQN
jgi:hypothetical protein